jgi:S-adenosylmethionine hydrolase
LHAEIISIDGYGNVQTAATATQLRSALRVRTTGEPILVGTVKASYGETFGSVAQGEVVVFEDSAGLIAIAVNGGDARALLRAEPGSLIRLRRG